MHFPNIIELIDEYLERLIEVRSLLSDLDLPATPRKAPAAVPSRAARLNSKVVGRLAAGSVNRASKPKAVLRKSFKLEVHKLKAESLSVGSTKNHDTTLTAISEVPPLIEKPREPENQIAEVRTVVHARKQPSKKRIMPVKSPVRSGVSVLGGTIPTGPIVVSAQQIRIENSLRQQEATIRQDSVPSPNSIPLTSELLKQRWIQGAQSSSR